MIKILAQGERVSVTQIHTKKLKHQFPRFVFSFWTSFWSVRAKHISYLLVEKNCFI